MKSYTDLEQSKKLVEILPIESADMHYAKVIHGFDLSKDWKIEAQLGSPSNKAPIPCWSLAALLSIIKDKCNYFELVYLKSTTDGRANRLENVHRLSTDIYDIYEKKAIDAAFKMIIKLHELNLL